MDKLLEEICQKYDLDSDVIKKIIKIEKDNVHKKTRHIFGDLKEIINNAVQEEVN